MRTRGRVGSEGGSRRAVGGTHARTGEKRVGLVSVIGALCVVTLAGMGASRPASPDRSAPATGSLLASPMPSTPASAPGDVVRATLGNGLRVVIVHNGLAPVVTTMVNYLVGSNEEPDTFPGLAHAQEHMMFRGSPGLSADQLAEISAAIGGSFNADTRNTVTQYYFTAPAEDLDLALHIEAVRMSGVDDSQALWDKERGAIEQEVAADNSNPFYKFQEKMLAALYKGTPLADPGLGTRPAFDSLKAERLQAFHRTWYAPNNAVLVIVGNVDPNQALGTVKSLFGDIASKKIPARPAVQLQPVESETDTIPSDFPFGVAAIAVRMPGTSDPDFAAAEVMADVLNSQRGSLYALVPSGKALFAEFGLSPQPQAGVGMALAGYPKGGDAGVLLDEVRKIISDDLANGFPADLVDAAKRRELAQAEMQKNSVSGLANAWSDAVAVEGRQSPDEDIQAIQAVTPDAVARVARKYLTFDHAITAILPPEPSGKPTTRSSFGGSESFGSKNVKPVALPGWASNALSRLAVPASTVHPVVDTLSNGITLIVQHESVSQTVSVYGRIKSSDAIQEPEGKEGVSGVLDQLFSFGTTTRNRLEYQAALDSIAADESAGTGFYVSALSNHFDKAVELLADNELHPALPEMAFKTMQRQQAGFMAGQLQSPGYLAGRAQDEALFPAGDPELRQTTPATISGLTLQDVKDYYAEVFRPDMTDIVVIGDVTPQQARAVVEKYFGAWQAAGARPNIDLPPVPANKPSTATVPDKSRVQDEVSLAENLDLNRFNPDYYALRLGNEVLGGGFYASKLGQDLRESTGLVYSVSSSLSAHRTRATYSVDYACDPDKVSNARALVVKDLKEMQATPVDSARLVQAKAILMRQIPLSESSVGSIAGNWLAIEGAGLPLDEPQIAARHYLELTAKDVQAAFAKYLRPEGFVEVVQGPTPG